LRTVAYKAVLDAFAALDPIGGCKLPRRAGRSSLSPELLKSTYAVSLRGSRFSAGN
jgi:hypothetical protein